MKRKRKRAVIGPISKGYWDIYNCLDKNSYDRLYNVYLMFKGYLTYTYYSQPFEFFDFFKVLSFYRSSSLEKTRQAFYNTYKIGIQTVLFKECLKDAKEITDGFLNIEKNKLEEINRGNKKSKEEVIVGPNTNSEMKEIKYAKTNKTNNRVNRLF